MTGPGRAVVVVGLLVVVSAAASSGGAAARGPAPGTSGPSTADVTPVTGCTEITSPGHYRLAADVVNSTRNYCISVFSSDVVLDGAGHRVDGVDQYQIPGVEGEAATKGIRVRGLGYGPVTNVTVRNVVATDWGQGLFISRASDSRFHNDTGRSNGGYGIYVGYHARNNSMVGNRVVDNIEEGLSVAHLASDTVIVGTVAVRNGNGIEVVNSSGARVLDNRVVDNDVGITLGGTDDNVVADNVIEGNGGGVLIAAQHHGRLGSTNNTVERNHLADNGRYGILVDGNTTGTTIRDNVVAGSGGEAGIWLDGIRGGRLANNTVSGYRLGVGVEEAADVVLDGNEVRDNADWDVLTRRLPAPLRADRTTLSGGTEVSLEGRNVAVVGTSTGPALPAEATAAGGYLRVWPESRPAWVEVTLPVETAGDGGPPVALLVHDGEWRGRDALDRGRGSLSANLTDVTGETYVVAAAAATGTSAALTPTPVPPSTTSGPGLRGFGILPALLGLLTAALVARRLRC